MLRTFERVISILLSIGISIWLPLHFLYEPQNIGHAESFELIVAVPALFLIWIRIHNRRRNIQSDLIHSRAGLFLDITASLPLTCILALFGWTGLAPVVISKILFIRYLRSIKRITDSFGSLHPIFYRLLPIALVVPVIVHWLACGWVALGSGTAGHSDDAVFEYIRAVYWAFTTLTTVGYGDISARTIPQMLYACLSMVMGVGFFGFVLSNVAALLARLDAAREHHLSRLDRIETYMRFNGIQGELRTRIRTFFQFVWQHGQGFADAEILNDLPVHLKTEILFSIHKGLIQKVPLLRHADSSAIEELILDLHSRVCVPGEVVFAQNDEAVAMYFIKTGTIEIQTAQGETIAHLEPGQYFGEMSLVSKSPRSASAITSTYAELSVLSRATFEQTLNRHPKFRESVERTIAERKNSVPAK